VPLELLEKPDTTYSLGPSYPQLLGSLSGWFRGRGVPAEESKDLAQETIVRTLIHLKRHGQRGDDLKPLVFTIARNLLTERARRGVGNVVTLTEDIDVADTAPTPLDTVMQLEERSAVSEALAALGSRHKRVIELWMRGETPADIARTLGIKRNAADALLHRARRRLASILRESGQAFGGFLGVWGLKLKLRSLRVATFFSRHDPSAALAQAVSAVAAVSIAGVIAVAGTQGAAPTRTITTGHTTQTSNARGSVIARVAGARKTAASETKSAPAAPGGVYADLGTQHAGAGTNVSNPGNGQDTPIGIDVYHRGGSSHTDAIIDKGAHTICALNCPSVGTSK